MHLAGIHSVHQPHDRKIRAIPDSQINQTYIHNSLIIHLDKPIASADWKTPTIYGTTESVTGRQASSHTIALFMTYPAGGRVCPRSRSSSAGAVADPTATCCEGASADDPRHQPKSTATFPSARPSPTCASAAATSSSANTRSMWILTVPSTHESVSGAK